ncbi:hypothetical protein HKCCE2091_03455 [Rhodobacterales bacterium HKCCE2091]|nr:hypothetical protein [Rhodobacterales bacterium HKCCE2091]
MTGHGDTRRRLLIAAYRDYVEAEREFSRTLERVRAWFPAGARPGKAVIGEPGSPVRRAYDRREDAMDRLAVARRIHAAAARARAARERPGPKLIGFWLHRD